MRVSEICTRKVSTVGPDFPVLEAARRMREAHVGDLVVVDEHATPRKPIGVLTDRDLVVALLARDVDHLHVVAVGDVISGPVITAGTDEDLGPVLHRMRTARVRRVPVVDANGALCGILSIDDVIPALAAELSEIASLVREQLGEEAERRP